MAIASLNLLVLRCRELEAARKFYEVIGFTFQLERHGKGPEHYSCEDDQGVLELYPAQGEPDQTALGFVFEDLDQAFTRLSAAGYAPGAVGDGPYGRSFVVRDPDGRRVELKAKKSDKE